MKTKIPPIPLFDIKLLLEAKSEDIFQFECHHCKTSFNARKKDYTDSLNKSCHTVLNFCSQKCTGLSRLKQIKCTCKQCSKEFSKKLKDVKKTKNNNFCSRSCAATYNNLHKTTGSRRSKLELWLEQKLTILYPYLQILYCDKTTINSELDIYIPSLKLAFELNGIYHYEPIHGKNKLDQVQSNDNRKFQACIEHAIELVIMDVSTLKYFKEQNCLKYLDIIKNIINIAESRGTDPPTF